VGARTNVRQFEHRTIEERNEGRPALRRVPAKLAKGWGGVHAIPSAPPHACMSAPGAPSPIRTVLTKLRNWKPAKAPSPPPPPKPAATRLDKPVDRLRALLSSQAADGSFELNDAAIREIGGEWRWVVNDTFVDMFGKPSGPSLIHTVLALLLLRQAFADQQRLLRRAEAKAIRFLASSLGKPRSEVERWLANGVWGRTSARR
jgi:hypothetical protein